MILKQVEMGEFDHKAAMWDANPMHLERSQAIAAALLQMVPVNTRMRALEFGAGTGLLSIELRERLSFIDMVDNSCEMVRIMNEKIERHRFSNMKAHCLDLEIEDFPTECDLIYTQMVVHHVADLDQLFRKFHGMLKPGGYLAIADLFAEDGSFHDDQFTGHKGFDIGALSEVLKQNGFSDIRHQTCFIIRKTGLNGEAREYPVFLLTARVMSVPQQ